MSRLFASGGQSIRVSASASVLAMNIQERFPLGLTGLISSQCKGLSRVFSSATIQKNQFFGAQPSLWSNSHIHTWLSEKPLEKEMATHSNILAWEIPWTEEPGRLWSTGSQRVRHDWVTKTANKPSTYKFGVRHKHSVHRIQAGGIFSK